MNDNFLIVSVIGICFAAFGIYILKRGWARRWQMFPFLGVLGSSILGVNKVYGGWAIFAGIIHIAVGLFFVVAAFTI